MGEKLRLYGFNNLTKALSFNIYDVCYAKTPREQRDYIAYIDEQYNSERLTNILTTLTDMIGAKVLNIARQDYDPQGASVTILIAEGSMVPAGETQLAHLDKSHVTVHTYPEYHPETCLATFRVDIDVATCGAITPLSTLDYLRGDHAPVHAGLFDRLLRLGHHHHGLPGAGLYPGLGRQEAVLGPRRGVHPALYRPGDFAPV